MMAVKSININIGGEAGDGILSAGEILCNIFFEAGLGLCTYKNFPSRIRGGHTSYSIRAGENLLSARAEKTDILAAFDEDTFKFHNNELKDNSIVIYDPAKIKNIKKSDNCRAPYYEIPLSAMAAQISGGQIYKNAILIGVISAVLNISEDHVKKGFEKSVGAKKSGEVLAANLAACAAGKEYYKKLSNAAFIKLPEGRLNNGDYIMITGNEAMTLGAIAGGCKFIAAYPISPATEIFEMMCSVLPETGGTAMQAEDEIAALCAAIGAGFAGARSMTSTSGPGLSLMAEAIGLAGCAEVPVVIIDAQRPGPSTGLPTKTEQGDLYHALFCSHGDIPRIVIAASSVAESFELCANAFNLAEIYQCPVILLTEQAVAQNKFIAPEFDYSKITIDRGKLLTEEELGKPGYKFLRYKYCEDGVSPRAIPSQKGGVHLCNGNEHLESGRITEEPALRTKITDKRMKKIESAGASKYLPAPLFYGNENGRAEYGIIAMGSAANAAIEALDIIKENNNGTGEFKVMQIRTLMPFNSAAAADFISGCKKVYVIENNKTAQLCGLIKMQLPVHDKLHSILKYNGISFSAVEIAEKLMEVE